MHRVQFWRLATLAASCALVFGITAPRTEAQGTPKQPDTVILKGNPQGGVKFDHKTHASRTKECTTCHHASKPEKPSKSANQKCSDCHTKTAAAPMKTNIRSAFHDPMAKKGTCMDCHVKERAKNAKANVPVKCAECHKKENG